MTNVVKQLKNAAHIGQLRLKQLACAAIIFLTVPYINIPYISAPGERIGVDDL